MFTKYHFRCFFNKKSKTAELASINKGTNKSLNSSLQREAFWQKFKTWLFSHFKDSEKLTLACFKAKVQKEINEAEKIEAQSNIIKQKEIQEFNKIINEIFTEDGLPKIAKALKLAKVIEKNPNILPQLKLINEIVERFEQLQYPRRSSITKEE